MAEPARPLPEPRAELVAFALAGQRYALPLSGLREVLPRAALTPVPGAPGEVVGLLRVRGALLPVVDLRRRLGVPPAPARTGDRIIVLRDGPVPAGVLADSVEGLVRVDTPISNDQPEIHGAPASRLVRSVLETPDGVLTILNPEAVLGPEGAALLQAVLPGGAVLPDRERTELTLTAPVQA